MIDQNSARNLVLDAVEEGTVDKDRLIGILLCWLSESEVEEMLKSSIDIREFFPHLCPDLDEDEDEDEDED